MASRIGVYPNIPMAEIITLGDDGNDLMKDYEFSISHHDDESYYGSDDYYEPMGHFKD